MRSRLGVVCGALALGCAAPFASACSSDTFTASADDASVSEAAASDTTPTDSATPDAADDAGVFCSQVTPANLILCADFDEADQRTALTTSGFGIFFSTTEITDGGFIFHADGGSSLPSSIESAIPGDVGDASIVAQTFGTLSDAPGSTHFHVTADLRFNDVGNVSGSGTIAVFAVALSGPLATTSFELVINSGHVEIIVLDDNVVAAGIDLGIVPSPPTNWLPFVADIVTGVGGKTVASLNGVSGNAAPYVDPTHTRPSVELGLAATGQTGTLNVSYDNVLIYADDGDAGDGG